MATHQLIEIASFGGPTLPSAPSSIPAPVETSSGSRVGAVAGPSTFQPKTVTQRIRPGILSRQASEREESADPNSYLHSASEDDDARQSDTGSLPRRFPIKPNSAASSLRGSRSGKSPSPLSSNFNSGGYGSRSIHSAGGEASASSSRSHLPLQSKTSLYARQGGHDGTRGGDWSEDGASGKNGITFGSDSLSRAKSVSSVSSVNSTSSMEAVPFRAAPLGNVRVGYAGYAGRRSGQGRGNAAAQEKQTLKGSPPPPHPASESSPSSSLDATASSPNAGKQRLLPKDPSEEWHYRNPPGMGTKSGARNAMGTYHTTASPRNIERGGLSSGSGGIGDDGGDIANSPTSTIQASRAKPSIRSKLAKRAGKLGLKPLTTMALDYSSSPNSVLQSLEQILPSQVVETRDPNNGVPAGSVTLPIISIPLMSPDSTSRSTKSYFTSSGFPVTSHAGMSADGETKIQTSSVTYAPLIVPKHPPGPPGSGPPPSPGLTGAPSPYHPFALASPLVSPFRMGEDIDPLSSDKELKVPEDKSAKARSYDTEPKKAKRSSGNGLLGGAHLSDFSQRHSLPATARAPSPRRPSTSPSVITPAQQIQKDVLAGVARAPAEPSGSNPGSNPLVEQAIKKDAEGLAAATRLHSYSTRVESDFLFGDILGEGSYSTVLEAWDLKPLREKGKLVSTAKPESNLMGAMVGKRITAKQRADVEGAKVYAIKVLDKMHILKEKKQKYVGVEREALSLLIRHPGVITLYWTFHDRDNLYFITELASNGELLGCIKKLGSFDTECTRYYGSQLIETIEAMHVAGVLHRDLKPENILLDSEMRIKVADFGSAKLFKKEEKQRLSSDENSSSQSERTRTSSFVGTAEYVSPELLAEKQVSEASDWWSFGCLLFQMLCGKPPFKGASEYQTFQKIMKRDFEYPPGLSTDAIALIDGLLVLDAEQRFTYKDIREHAFFKECDWSTVWKCQAPELKVGIYQRPAPSATSMAVVPKWEGELDSLLSRDTNIASISEDGSKSDIQSVQDSTNSLALSDEPLSSRLAKEEYEVQDADDDDSSFSDSNSPAPATNAPRRRGLSVGALATERRSSLGGSNGKRAGDYFRMAAGIKSSSDSKYESSKFGLNPEPTLSLRSSVLSPSSIQSISSGNAKQSSINRSSASLLYPSVEANKTGRTAMTQNKSGSTSNQTYSSLAISWAALLLPNESLLYSCPILHKTTGALLRSGTKKRQLLLTDFPRLLCVKETNNQLRVKSEVILGLPQLASMSLINHDWNAEDEDDDDDDEDIMQQRIAYSASQMRRQSSAGPSLASPSRAHANSKAVTNGELSSPGNISMRGMERRESFPISRQQSFPTTNSAITFSSGNFNNYLFNNNNNNILQSNNNNNIPNNRLSLLTSSSTSNMASTMDTSPNFMTQIEQKSTRTFSVTTPAKSFLYEDPSGDATHWVKSILLAANRGDTTSS